MLLSARGRIPTHAERTLSAYTISKVTWRDGAPCFRGHGASVAASKGKSSCFPDVTSDRGTATVPRKSSPVIVVFPVLVSAAQIATRLCVCESLRKLTLW